MPMGLPSYRQVIGSVCSKCSVRQMLTRFLCICFVLAPAGCNLANKHTIERSTELPSKHSGPVGKAVHLDIQQRLLIVNSLGKYCAEPSPDALASFVGAIGIGAGYNTASTPTNETLGALQALSQSAAASVGLRTQSITLMRDALFRMCEAYMNNALSQIQVATLLHRSQDLTAVVLAVEQLTGAVVARQISLTNNAADVATAKVTEIAELLDKALAAEEQREKELEQANAELATAKMRYTTALRALNLVGENDSANLSFSANDNDTNISDNSLQPKQLAKELSEHSVANAEKRVDHRKQNLDRARRIREEIESKQDAAIANLSTSIRNDAEFSGPVQKNQLDKSVSEQVAKSVEGMVNNVINKDYTVEYCMAVITSISDDSLQTVGLEKTKKLCLKLMNKNIEERTISLYYGYDDLSKIIDVWSKKEEMNRNKLIEWLKENYDIRISDLLLGRRYRELRQRAIIEFNINKGERE